MKGLKALVCGATGISGFHTMRALLDTPDRWSCVYAVSRKPLPEELLAFFTPDQRSRIKHVAVDFTKTAEEIAQALKDAQVIVNYVFFYSYIQPKTPEGPMMASSAQALVDANVPILENFLNALPLANIKPKRILLQTGGKNYGITGRVRTPMVESDPQPRHLGPNFYYPQEDMLKAFCAAHPETSWNVIRPFGIIGSIINININMMYGFAVYASVQAHKNEPLRFGGDIRSWQFEACHSTARLTGYLAEWAVLEENCANEAFNSHDSSPLSWDRFFHELARWYDVKAGVIGPDEEPSHYRQSMALNGGREAPLGYGPPLPLKQTFRLLDWARKPTNQAAWEDMKQKSKGQLRAGAFDEPIDDNFMGDYAYLPIGQLSRNKVQRFGFCGFVDTLESTLEMFHEMAQLGMLPPPKVKEAYPLV